jgi:3-O-methylgallate 3,4-dioxygenase
MATVAVGIGTSHSPMVNVEPKYWHVMAEYDQLPGKELMSPRSGKLVSYEALLAEADPAIAVSLTAERYARQHEAIQRGIASLEATMREARPDVAIVIGADQEELLFDDNMPAISIYWGDTIRLQPWTMRDGLPEAYRVCAWGYGTETRDCAVDTALAEHLIGALLDDGFDVATARYHHDEYGGSVGPAGYLDRRRETKRRSIGMAHAWSFVVTRIMGAHYVPLVPIAINACYPPNQPKASRCYALGRAIARAVEGLSGGKRVAVIASGGLSHYVVDEELDRAALAAMGARSAEAIGTLPEHRLQSAAAEIKPWICAAGALEALTMEVVAYEPARRTPAGTGGGWGFARWT